MRHPGGAPADSVQPPRLTGNLRTLSDDGRGFDVAAVERMTAGGIGLALMRERIEALGGGSRSHSGSRGTEIEAFLPAEERAEEPTEERAEERDQEPAEERHHGDDQNPA